VGKQVPTKRAWPVVLVVVLLVAVLICFSMWLLDPPRCAFAPQVRIGGSMLVAGCK
jgi:hypothetical protein